MMSETRRVAVIGAGASGLTAIKCCLDDGLVPVCFERTDSIGGLWCYRDKRLKGQTSVMKSTVTNSSKELMCYSDFPMPKHFANCMHNSQLVKYFHLYADHFNLKRHIKHQTEVLSVEKADDYSTSGRWKVCHRHVRAGDTDTEVFDAVLVCSGSQTDIRVPEFEGLKDFQGKVLHTNDYQTADGFEDKTVLIVGMGNSAGDCAVDLSRVAKQVFLSTRRGSWVAPRLSEHGLPMDLVRVNRFKMFLEKHFRCVCERWAERKLNARFDHTLYRLKPDHGFFSYQSMLNDDLPSRILTGSVKVKDDVRRFKKSCVEFVDGSTEQDVDAVILATGFTTDFPFLDKNLLKREVNNVPLYRLMFPPDLDRGTLAVIGCFQPVGSLMPMAEMQCRVATRVFKGLVALPDSTTMWADIRQRQVMAAAAMTPTQRYTVAVPQIPYMDELGRLIGCCPDFVTTFLTDPILAIKLWFGPVYPYSYRLCGPGKWQGAREAIVTAMDRVKAPFNTRSVSAKKDHSIIFGLWQGIWACISAFILGLMAVVISGLI
ncbi:hypothetical protein RRG08_008834 [Elysia crispata]|uniref:Flavin-containing monooxygenase n=1 Tax=Elysia crispata TaxID=231223 RepID=A0AAE0ZHC7_9GAST|nr:hypothetical protein RRG08_008834 [Elysia crispata]